jgi:HlyD family secretion protein
MTGSSKVAAVVSLAALAGAAFYYWPKLTQKAVKAAAKPSVVRADSRDVSAAVTATGTIRLRTGAEVRVGTQISGIVTKLNVTVGSHIGKDAVIAEIESRGLEARIAQARSQIEVDQASLSKLERELERSRKLLAERLIPRQQTEELEDDLKSASARLEKSRSDLIVVESDLPYLTIRSPIAGTVASVSTQQGETVAASFNAPTFVTIIEDNALELVAMVDETDIANVRPLNGVLFSTETYPAREFRGTVERIAPKATVVSGVVNYEVGIRIRSGLAELKPDMTANVTIDTARHRSAK